MFLTTQARLEFQIKTAAAILGPMVAETLQDNGPHGYSFKCPDYFYREALQMADKLYALAISEENKRHMAENG